MDSDEHEGLSPSPVDVTLLGSGDAVGMPAPLCDCGFCAAGPRRRRPGLLVETQQSTVVLDASPDLKEQLHATGSTGVDAFFLTHHHYDHVGGLGELAHAAMGFDAHVGIEGGYLDPAAFDEREKPRDPEFDVYLTDTARGHVADHLEAHLDFRPLAHGAAVEVGDLDVLPFPVEHARSAFDTLGFRVESDGATVVYAPDMRAFHDDADGMGPAGGPAYVGADLLFAEGAVLFRTFGHGEEADLRAALAGADADRTVLLNCNEHLQRMTTAEMGAVAGEEGYELGSDFAEYRVE